MNIFKYELPKTPGRFKLLLPKGSIPLSIGVQYDTLVLWALVDEFEDDLEYSFHLLFIGQYFEETNLKFIGTVQHPNGLVYHLFKEI